ncbi:MAG: type IV pilus assembly protein PilM [Nitrospina sp.]|jgi:type IV pilus assembly protein PilM|nr:type IV pilus assembly protein PilM [Nitrospina sp.]MBT3415885.1 type IV pilus assembly protein PilM [Nitrospina sp.]MBT3856484.1 type IV pilus assembly protein PilM [Nitrospina sp.]MBT4103303.1 type IV pilus assembly protein PilM [Nitrospina sp.]MBT4389415.1 type IV pilus assembly protein PilM [Nitrospina sp.]
MFLSKKTQLVAIDIGSSSIKLVQLSELKDGEFELTHFGMMPLAEECIVEGAIKKPDLVAKALADLIKAEKIQSRYAVSAVAGEAVFIKKIKVPVMSEEELSEKITQEAEQYIPFDIDDVALDFQLLGTVKTEEAEEFDNSKNSEFNEESQSNDSQQEDSNEEADEEMMEVLLVAVQRAVIDERTDILLEVGLKPAIIDLNVFALMNAAQLTNDLSSMGVTALIDLGDSFTHINIIQDGTMGYTRDIPVGGDYCTKMLMSKFKVPFNQTLAIKRGNFSSDIDEEEVVKIISQAYKKVLEEVQKSFEYFGTLSGSKVDRVLLCGGGSMIRGLDGFFADYLDVPVEILNPMQGVKINPKNFDNSLIDEMGGLSTVALGLATRRFDYT